MRFYDRAADILFPYVWMKIFSPSDRKSRHFIVCCRPLSLWETLCFLTVFGTRRHTTKSQTPISENGIWPLSRCLPPTLVSVRCWPTRSPCGTEARSGAKRFSRCHRLTSTCLSRWVHWVYKLWWMLPYDFDFTYSKVSKIRETAYHPRQPSFSLRCSNTIW